MVDLSNYSFNENFVGDQSGKQQNKRCECIMNKQGTSVA